MEALSTFAEISLGLAGFAGIAVVLSRSPGALSPADGLRIAMLLSAAFGALFATLIPIALLWGGLSEDRAILGGSVGISVTFAYWMVRGSARVRALPARERSLFNRNVARVIMSLIAVGLLSQVPVILRVSGKYSALLYSYGVISLLAWASWGFCRLLFVRPPADEPAA